MLVQLYIENVAVIQKAAIQLTPGLNVLTGETGAGKTMLLSALDAVLGERTSREIIRTGEDRAVVSALFEDISAAAVDKLRELGYQDDDGALLITREITAAGKTTCKIGGMPATTAILREIAPLLLHIHGQRDSRQLLLDEQHIRLVDAFGELEEDIARYGESYAAIRGVEEQLQALEMDDAQKAQRIDMLTFQVAEIEGARLEDEEEEDVLLARRGVIRNSERIVEGLSAAYGALSGGEEGAGIEALMDTLLDGVGDAAQFVEQFSPAAARMQEMQYELREYAAEIRAYLDEFEYNPQELDYIESRLDTIHKLKKKYGGSVGEVREFCERAREELAAITTSDQRAAALGRQLEKLRAEAGKLAAGLTKKRRRAADAFTAQVEAELLFLDMPAVKLSVQMREKPLGPDGADDLRFFIVTNIGEEPKPLSKIASGGEIARIMLAVKNVLADRDRIATLVFDEVDTGVSGRAAGKIGRKLRQVSADRQVVCVTHLAQVAACAHTHLFIRKEVEEGRTFTRITPLDKGQIVEELARIMSGDLLTEAALQSAEQLWQSSQQD